MRRWPQRLIPGIGRSAGVGVRAFGLYAPLVRSGGLLVF